MKKGTLKLALGLAAGLFTLAVLARQSGFVTLWEGLGASFTTAVAEDVTPENDACLDAIPLIAELNACPDIDAPVVLGTLTRCSNESLRPRGLPWRRRQH
ncbi:MAG: hypothetical protein IPL27_08965 [Lewinellaceae bacterium]|nr:hypothetical protein [Lewinellaceae bacterium]